LGWCLVGGYSIGLADLDFELEGNLSTEAEQDYIGFGSWVGHSGTDFDRREKLVNSIARID
jgi:hypothetical protein